MKYFYEILLVSLSVTIRIFALEDNFIDQIALGRFLSKSGDYDSSLPLLRPISADNTSASGEVTSYFGYIEVLKASGYYRMGQWKALFNQMETQYREDISSTGSNSFVYALASVAHTVKDFHKATKYLEAANSFEKRHYRQWDSLQFVTKKRKQISFFSSAFWDALSKYQASSVSSQDEADTAVKSPSVTPIFIIGMPHSGAELLEQTLSKHSEIFGLNAKREYFDAVKYSIDYRYRRGMLAFHESEIMKETIGKMRSKPEAETESETNAKADTTISSVSFTGEVTAGMKKYHDIIANNMAGIARLALAASGEAEKARQGVQYVVDTDVENFLNVGLIHLLFPSAIIINVMREPLDVLLNIYQQRGSYSDGNGAASCFGYAGQGRSWSLDSKHMAEYYLGYLDITHHWRTTLQPKGIFFDVAYEQLRHPSTTVETLQPILRALGLEYESEMSLVGLDSAKAKTGGKEMKKVMDTTGSWKQYQSHLEPLVELLKEPFAYRRANGTLPLTENIKYSLL